MWWDDLLEEEEAKPDAPELLAEADAYLQHAVAALTQKGMSKSRAFAVAIAQGQKAGYYKPGTKQLTAKGKKAARRHAGERDHRFKEMGYETAIKRQRPKTEAERTEMWWEDDEALEESLSPFERDLLAYMTKTKSDVTVGALRYAFKLTPQKATKILQGLVQKGHLQKDGKEYRLAEEDELDEIFGSSASRMKKAVKRSKRQQMYSQMRKDLEKRRRASKTEAVELEEAAPVTQSMRETVESLHLPEAWWDEDTESLDERVKGPTWSNCPPQGWETTVAQRKGKRGVGVCVPKSDKAWAHFEQYLQQQGLSAAEVAKVLKKARKGSQDDFPTFTSLKMFYSRMGEGVEESLDERAPNPWHGRDGRFTSPKPRKGSWALGNDQHQVKRRKVKKASAFRCGRFARQIGKDIRCQDGGGGRGEGEKPIKDKVKVRKRKRKKRGGVKTPYVPKKKSLRQGLDPTFADLLFELDD
jgi:hypothetical protein